jgi:hypothetical protein
MPEKNHPLCLCVDCGGQRQLLGDCRLCGSFQIPEAIVETLIFNIKVGYPIVEDAVGRFETYLDAACDAGFKSMILIHGYGSSGPGGLIRKAIRSNLENNYYVQNVSDYYFGENLQFGNLTYEKLLKRRSSIKKHSAQFIGNLGASVLLLK